jgi:hypothetical protein
MSNLREFFVHKLYEGPRDPAFKPAPEIKPGDAAAIEPGLDAPAGDLPMTQDVAAMSASSLSFFAKNVQSAVSKFGDLAADGFDSSSLDQFAEALDGLVFQMYQGVQEPAERQAFEADYQKLAADWSTDLTKLFDKVLKLKAHSAQY